ncbi:MAG: hypothetical protein M1840_000952 [Geoglossum simile]|nr:MAG: hypothetical protein M1840_000952 [Geoglossum simile]
MKFSKEQLYSLEVTERVTSVFSLIGTSFIIATFLISSDYHKPINRLVFYASFGNIVTNIATLISRSSIHAGDSSPLCQLQAFLIQMFMPADSLWTLAMACNVYLVFFKKYSSAQLRKLEWKYFLACYGLPSVTAIAFLFVQTDSKGKVYGQATVITLLRAYAIWQIIYLRFLSSGVGSPQNGIPYESRPFTGQSVTVLIYVIVGIDIFKKRSQLRKFSHPRPNRSTLVSKTTKVEVTSEPAATHRPKNPWELRRVGSNPSPTPSYTEYSITIESGPGVGRDSQVERPLPSGNDYNSASWGYARIAFIFFVALLVTWVPSSVNRVYSLAHPEKANFPMNFVASLVLPLQGFWNGLIYFTTSLPATRKLWRRWTGSGEKQRISEPDLDVHSFGQLNIRQISFFVPNNFKSFSVSESQGISSAQVATLALPPTGAVITGRSDRPCISKAENVERVEAASDLQLNPDPASRISQGRLSKALHLPKPPPASEHSYRCGNAGMPVTFKPAVHDAKPVSFHHPPTKTSRELLPHRHHRNCVGHIQSSFPNLIAHLNVYSSPNGFINAAIEAYSRHHHLIIRPDDVWIAILTQFSAYVNEHAEDLRGLFVGHHGKERLVAAEFGDRHSANFGEIAQRMGCLLEGIVVDPELRRWIVPDFTTSTDNDRIVSSIVMMTTLQKYFSYKSTLMCGLPSRLRSFGYEPEQWYNLLKPVLSRFVSAFDSPHSEENFAFWRTIAHRSSNGSGPVYYSGWITAFCFWDEHGKPLHAEVSEGLFSRTANTRPRPPGLVLDGVTYHSVDTDDIPVGYASVPMKVSDNGILLNTIMVAGSIGFRASSRGVVGLDTLQPVVGWWIFESKSHEELDALAIAEAEQWKRICEEIASREDESYSSEL